MEPKSKTYLDTFLASLPPDHPAHSVKYEAYYFCADEESANTCADLVIRGEKRATAGLLWSYEAENEALPEIGDLAVVTNWDGEPMCIIETTSVEIQPYNTVSAEFAFEEGEGDKSLEFWRRVHWEFFSRECEDIGREPARGYAGSFGKVQGYP